MLSFTGPGAIIPCLFDPGRSVLRLGSSARSDRQRQGRPSITLPKVIRRGSGSLQALVGEGPKGAAPSCPARSGKAACKPQKSKEADTMTVRGEPTVTKVPVVSQ